MKNLILFTSVFCLVLSSCITETGKKIEAGVAYEYYADGKVKSETQVKDTLAHGLMKNYDRDGNLMSVYTFNMSKLDGPAVSYYPNGKIEQKMFYTNGRREGTSQWFYSTGELYRQIPFKDGKINGTKISYYKDGKIMAEAPVLNDMPGLGLREFNMKGELLKDDTKIIVKEDDRLFAESRYVLNISLSNPKPGASFYLGELTEGKFISPNQWQLPEKDGVAIYSINLEKGRFRMETLILTASYRTGKSNYRVITRTYNLAVDNK
jgi:hypothetical protein